MCYSPLARRGFPLTIVLTDLCPTPAAFTDSALKPIAAQAAALNEHPCAEHTTQMDQLYLRCEDRIAAWGESLRACCDACERTCCGALIARKKTRAALICGLDGVGKTTVLCCVPAVRRNLEKWARKHGVDELHTAPTWGHQ